MRGRPRPAMELVKKGDTPLIVAQKVARGGRGGVGGPPTMAVAEQGAASRTHRPWSNKEGSCQGHVGHGCSKEEVVPALVVAEQGVAPASGRLHDYPRWGREGMCEG
jgi:hypothetical protein